MTTHHLEPTPTTVADVFSRDLPPVLAVDPGDRLVVRSLDASGYLSRQRFPGDRPPQLIPSSQYPMRRELRVLTYQAIVD